jgi:hypothetical protein
MFRHINRSNHLLGMLNVLFLMGISCLPFSTSLVATFIRNPIEQRTAVLVYVGTFLGCALLFCAVWLYATHRHRLVEQTRSSRVHPENHQEVLCRNFCLSGCIRAGVLEHYIQLGHRGGSSSCFFLSHPTLSAFASDFKMRPKIRMSSMPLKFSSCCVTLGRVSDGRGCAYSLLPSRRSIRVDKATLASLGERILRAQNQYSGWAGPFPSPDTVAS